MNMNFELGDSEDDLAAVASFHDWAKNLGYKTARTARWSASVAVMDSTFTSAIPRA